jgi:5-oxoprolinase (ATP-hydrolysing)
VLEWITWGGGGLGDPLTRPASKVALEVHRRLVTVDGAAKNYGVVVRPDYTVDEAATTKLRAQMRAKPSPSSNGAPKAVNGNGSTHANGHTNGHAHADADGVSIDRGGSLHELIASCAAETGLPPPRPQWERDPYGPHVALPYVKEWYKKMRKGGLSVWDGA